MQRILTPIFVLALGCVLAASLTAAHANPVIPAADVPLLQEWDPPYPGLTLPRDWAPSKKPFPPKSWEDPRGPKPPFPRSCGCGCPQRPCRCWCGTPPCPCKVRPSPRQLPRPFGPCFPAGNPNDRAAD